MLPLTLLLLLAPPAPLLTCDFEQGLPPGWQPAAGTWAVIPEPGQMDNHVLALVDSPSGQIGAGDPAWTDITLSARMKVETKAPVYHCKAAVRRLGGAKQAFCNLRNDSPVAVYQDGQQFAQLGSCGTLGFAPGEWMHVEVTAVGKLLDVKLWRDSDPQQVNGGRFVLPSLAHGGIGFTVWTNSNEPVKLMIDDVRVTAAEPLAQGTGETLVLGDDRLEVKFDTTLGTFSLHDRRANLTWTQQPANLPQVRSAKVVDGGLTADLLLRNQPCRLDLKLEGHGELLATLTPTGKGTYTDLSYPAPLLPADPQCELVMPVDEGVILPVTQTADPIPFGRYHYGQAGWIMPWAGMVKGDSGIMALIETPADWLGEVRPGQLGETPVTALGVGWLPSLTGLRYPRKLRYCLFAEGGYVAMAKRYRRLLVEQKRFRTLAEKAAELPQVNGLLGAINIFGQGDPQQVYDWMQASGIDRAVLSISGPPELVRKAVAAGYIVNRYDIYTDVAGPELLKIWGPPKSHLDYRRIGYPDECFIQRDGTPLPGFAYAIGAKNGVDPKGREGKRIRCFKRRTVAQLPWMKRVIPPQLAESGYNARFIDVETAHQPYESYHEGGPRSREQDIQDRIGLFDYLRSLGQVCSSEGGADYPAMALHYQEGSVTITRWGSLPGVYVGTAPFKLPEDYIRLQFDPSIRLPLHALVYHDSVLLTWRWNHTPNRWDRRDLWDDWDLLHLLYGELPILVVEPQGLQEYGPRIVQTWRNVCLEERKFAGSEMVRHRFVTPDRLVQQATYANGRAVLVNFGTEQYVAPQGVVAPKGSLPFEVKGAQG